ncbi:MAG: divergent polysaccharide deacetylase family protein [Sphingomonadaceae bacterium]|nr:divergent polysaccharide deacetylase family protein [Sphingomonadaceae bacterium]
MLFIGLATLFVELLRPLAPSHAAAQTGDTRRAPPPEARIEAKEAAASGTLRPPIAQVPVTDIDKPQIDETRLAAGETPPAPTAAAPAAAAAAPIPDGPIVAVILTELGPNAAAAKAAIDRLPAAVSLAFSPYADASRDLAKAAKAGGHEVWLSVPMQPKSYPRVNPGQNVLLTGEAPAENVRRLNWALSRVEAPVGVTNMMGSAFTENAAAMRPVLDAVKAKRLFYVDARSSGRSVGETEARAIGLAAATNDRFLDEPETPANIRRNLDALVDTAKRRGYAVGYARPVSATIAEIERWSAELEAKGVTLVGASLVARKASDG